MYFRIVALKDFAMFTEKHLCWSLFLINVQAWRSVTLLRRDSRKFAKFLRTSIFTERIRWLLLEISYELSLYCIWEQWMVLFRGTCWLPSVYFILLRVFRFFLFLFFFWFFLWIPLLFSLEVSLLSILKKGVELFLGF